MSAVQLIPSTEGAILQVNATRKLRFVNGAWRIHANNPADEAPALQPIRSATPPDLPNSNPFWYSLVSGQLHYQHVLPSNETVWMEVQDTDRYDITVADTTVMDLSRNQFFKVDNSTETIKNLVISNEPVGRAMAVVVAIHGDLGTVNFPVQTNWSNGQSPVLGPVKTVVLLLWDGESLSGSVSHTY